MILQELMKLYEKLVQDERKLRDGEVFPPGFSKEGIGFRIVISEKGEFITLEDLREKRDKKLFPAYCVVPKWDGKRAAGIRPYFLWDNCKYILGRERKGKNPEAQKAFLSYIDEVCAVAGEKPCSIEAVERFIQDKSQQKRLLGHENATELIESQSFIGFAIQDMQYTLLTDEEYIKDVWRIYLRKLDEEAAEVERILFGNKEKKESEEIEKRHQMPVLNIDLITGEKGPVYPLHPTIKRTIVTGGKNDIPFVSFNADSFCSYKKKKSYNAPVSRKTAFSFTTAINYLMSSDKHNLRIGDVRTLYWAEKNTDMETMFGMLMGSYTVPQVADDSLSIFLKSMKKGVLPPELDDDNTDFFILGLSQNAARVVVKYWYRNTVSRISRNLFEHLADTAIVGPENMGVPTVRALLRQTAINSDDDKIPSPAVSAFYRSVLQGYPYPQTALALLLNRMRHEQDDPRRRIYKIGYYRAAFIKAILNRNYKKELSMALDLDRKEPAYLCGRLFAVLEKIQRNALGENLNTTIKDRYFSTASTSPQVVFPQLIRLSQNHLKKIKGTNKGLTVNMEKMLQSIVTGLQQFPAILDIKGQGEFAIGYYHQVQDFYTKKNKQEE